MAAPAGSIQDRVIERYTTLLTLSKVEPELLPAWYSEVVSLIRLMQSLHKDRNSILKSLRASGNPLLLLVADIYALDEACAHCADIS